MDSTKFIINNNNHRLTLWLDWARQTKSDVEADSANQLRWMLCLHGFAQNRQRNVVCCVRVVSWMNGFLLQFYVESIDWEWKLSCSCFCAVTYWTIKMKCAGMANECKREREKEKHLGLENKSITWRVWRSVFWFSSIHVCVNECVPQFDVVPIPIITHFSLISTAIEWLVDRLTDGRCTHTHSICRFFRLQRKTRMPSDITAPSVRMCNVHAIWRPQQNNIFGHIHTFSFSFERLRRFHFSFHTKQKTRKLKTKKKLLNCCVRRTAVNSMFALVSSWLLGLSCRLIRTSFAIISRRNLIAFNVMFPFSSRYVFFPFSCYRIELTDWPLWVDFRHIFFICFERYEPAQVHDYQKRCYLASIEFII